MARIPTAPKAAAKKCGVGEFMLPVYQKTKNAPERRRPSSLFLLRLLLLSLLGVVPFGHMED
jgi:hypothetical protein